MENAINNHFSSLGTNIWSAQSVKRNRGANMGMRRYMSLSKAAPGQCVSVVGAAGFWRRVSAAVAIHSWTLLLFGGTQISMSRWFPC